MLLHVNGKPHELPPGSAVAALVDEFALAGKRFAIELNGEIVPRGRLATTLLSPGDKLEVVVAVGGG